MAKETKSRFIMVQTLSLEKKGFGFPKKEFTRIRVDKGRNCPYE